MNPSGSRVPTFLARGLAGGTAEPFVIGGSLRGPGSAPPRAASAPAAPAPAPAEGPSPAVLAAAAQEAALAAERVRLTAEFGHRVAAAIEVLRMSADRLAADMRVEAIELALLVARRILEAEVTSSVEPLVALVRGAVRRLGESRKIVVRLAPPDAEAVLAAAVAAGQKPLAGLAVAEIDVLPDASLSRGDCVVEGELGSVDGRLAARIEEVRRALMATVIESQTEPGL
jgi:flagellar biosynthesis/type III secretory pathway protein FliH